MRKAFLIFSLLASLAPSLPSFADNGVERGSIDFNSNSQLPTSVKNFLEKLMLARCDLSGTASIQPAYMQASEEGNDMGVFTMRYKIEFRVALKNTSEPSRIYANVVLFQTNAGDSRVDLTELASPLCSADR